MSSIRKALFHSFLGRYSTLTVDFVAILVISRLLTPEEIGLYSIAAASIVIGQILRDFGLSLYIIQEKNLTLDKIQTCFTASLLLCWTITIIYFFSSGLLANYFGNEQIEDLVKILSINFLIIPFGMITLSILKKNMSFGAVIKIDIASTLVRVIITVGYVFLDGGVYALAIGSVIGTIVSAGLAMRIGNSKHYRLRFSGFKQIATYSSVVSLGNIIGELRQIIPEFAIGKYDSIENVAFYSKASATSGLFTKLIMQAAGPTIQPYIAKLKNNNERLDLPMLRIFNFIQVFAIPFFCFMFAYSDSIVLLLYGEQWVQVPALLEVICCSMIIIMLLPTFEQLLTVLGDQVYVLKVGVVLLILRIFFIILFVVFDLALIEFLYLTVLISITRALLFFPKLFKTYSVSSKSYIKNTSVNILVSAILSFIFWLQIYILELNTDDILIMLGVMFSVFIIWIILLVVTKHEILIEFHRLQIFTKIKNKLNIQQGE